MTRDGRGTGGRGRSEDGRETGGRHGHTGGQPAGTQGTQGTPATPVTPAGTPGTPAPYRRGTRVHRHSFLKLIEDPSTFRCLGKNL